MMSDRKPSITVIGDSTIDNKIWVGLGLIKNVLRTKAHIKRADSDTRIASSQRRFFKYELSVVEHLKRSLPAFEVHDHTNDGFTTSDCLNGAYRDKVFGAGTLDLFPHQPFIPLVDGKDDIANSEHIIISVGGNNVREFLHAAIKIGNEAARKDYIKTNFPKVREKLKQEYIELVGRVRAINPHAKIILMTQYYPSFMQSDYKIYTFMKELGEALDLGNEPSDVIHNVVRLTYNGVLNVIDKTNISVADVTSSINPFNSKNHVKQIEPSGEGGRKIAKLLTHVINQSPVSAGQVYHIEPGYPSEYIIGEPLAENWSPKHPHEFTNKKCYDLLKEVASLCDEKYAVGTPMYQAFHNVHEEGMALLKNLRKCDDNGSRYSRQQHQDAADLERSLSRTVSLLRLDLTKPIDLLAFKSQANDLKKHATKYANGKLSYWKKFIGALTLLAGVALMAAGAVFIPVTGGLSAVGIAGGVGLFAAGVASIHQGRQKGLSKALDETASAALVASAKA